MAIKKNRMKDVAFYSGFSYLREVYTGYFQSSDNGFGTQEVDGSFTLPASVKDRPPYVEFYITYSSDPSTRYSLLASDPIEVGVSTTAVRARGGINLRLPWSGSEPLFRINYIIYGTKV